MKKIAFFIFFAFSLLAAMPQSSRALELMPGDLIVTDFNRADQTRQYGTGRVLKVNPVTGETSIISEGGELDIPWGVVVDSKGNIIVSDQAMEPSDPGDVGAIIVVDPATGNQTILSEGGLLIRPNHMAIDGNGDILVGNLNWSGNGGLVRVNPDTGEQSLISGEGYVRLSLIHI